MSTPCLSGHSSVDVPPYSDLLDFINLHAQATEASVSDASKKPHKFDHSGRKGSTPIASNAVSADANASMCPACKVQKHPLFSFQVSESL